MDDGVRVQNTVLWSMSVPKRLQDRKSTLNPPPVFLCPAFIHYDARLVEGGSPCPLPFDCLKLSNEIAKHFLTNVIFFSLSLGVKRVLDILIRVKKKKKKENFRYVRTFIDILFVSTTLIICVCVCDS